MADGPENGRVAVIVPAYQAATSVAAVVSGARAALPGAPVYVVDDGSSDGTGAAAAAAGALVVRQPRNGGKGTALAAGIGRAVVDGAGLLVTLDADGQHPPEVLPVLLAPLRRGEADLVLGARSRSGGIPLTRRLSNWLSASVATRVGGVPELITDGVDGYLEGVGDISAQAARVVALLTDAKLHRKISKAARRTAGDRFCTDKIIPQYERYYEEVMAGRSVSGAA